MIMYALVLVKILLLEPDVFSFAVIFDTFCENVFYSNDCLTQIGSDIASRI